MAGWPGLQAPFERRAHLKKCKQCTMVTTITAQLTLGSMLRAPSSTHTPNWEIANGGKRRATLWGGGETYYRAPSKTFGGLRKWVFVWSVPVSSREGDMA